MLTPRLLQIYVFLSVLELSAGKLFSVDTIWKPYRLAAVFVVLVASSEVSCKRFDRYDKGFLAVVLTACGLSSVWLLVGITEPVQVSRQCVFVFIPFSMYLCMKFSIRTARQLAGVVRAFVLGALVSASYVIYEVVALGHTLRLAGLSGLAPELALHSGLALAFVLYPYPGRPRSGYLGVLGRASAGAMLCFSVVASGTRAAWLGLVISTAVVASMTALSRLQRAKLLKLLIPLALLIVVFAAFNGGLWLKEGAGGLEGVAAERMAVNGSLRTGSGRLEIWSKHSIHCQHITISAEVSLVLGNQHPKISAVSGL